MRILLDTHMFIWWDSEPHLLPTTVKVLCESAGTKLILSVASIWEMQIKMQLGKLHLRAPLANLVSEQQELNGIELLPVNIEHVLALDGLPLLHKDPFDRILIAQANVESIALASVDLLIRQYPVQLAG